MQVGDLVWCLSHDKYDKTKVIERRLAIISEVDYDCINAYVVLCCSSGNTGRTSDRYLEPFTKK